uniref:Uncharacterized protein n=1 Tax=Rhizophagus irregularis (strain DAOM 181602 / DAOM 197198 / MUCL 43194) TaxID=747089 RepID=U9UK47_RHIID
MVLDHFDHLYYCEKCGYSKILEKYVYYGYCILRTSGDCAITLYSCWCQKSELSDDLNLYCHFISYHPNEWIGCCGKFGEVGLMVMGKWINFFRFNLTVMEFFVIILRINCCVNIKYVNIENKLFL